MKHILTSAAMIASLGACVAPVSVPREQQRPVSRCDAAYAALAAEEARLARAEAVNNLPFFVGTVARVGNPVIYTERDRLRRIVASCR